MKNPAKLSILRSISLAFLLASFSITIVSCNQVDNKEVSGEVSKEVSALITEDEVLEIQKVWGEGIVKIGSVYLQNGDYKTAAINHIDELYGYNLGTVLFKPTLASIKQFRTDKEGALSYFIGGNANYPEDHGFAIKPWSNVRWESTGVKTIGNMAVAMGNYYFTPANGGDEVKVEYTFGYTKDQDGKLRIILHGSHLPYSPPSEH